MGWDDPACCAADRDLDGTVGASDRLLLLAESIQFALFQP
jgi:hypothetical protein